MVHSAIMMAAGTFKYSKKNLDSVARPSVADHTNEYKNKTAEDASKAQVISATIIPECRGNALDR